MTTIIHNSDTSAHDDGTAGIIIGILAVLILVVLFFLYGLPLLRSDTSTQQPDTTINVEIPNTNQMPITPSVEIQQTP